MIPDTILSPSHPHFPAKLRLPGAAILEAKGRLVSQLDRLPPVVAIVGTRHPRSDEASYFTRAIAARLARSGVVVLSGGAIGIDREAHEGALSVGGMTIAILPAGLGDLTPRGHIDLFERITERGAVVGMPLPNGATFGGLRSEDRASRFFARNALIARLADHTVVTAARLRSGARNTAKHARTFGLPYWAVPGSPWDTNVQGCLAELALGARALCDVAQLFACLGLDEARKDEPLPFEAPPSISTRRHESKRMASTIQLKPVLPPAFQPTHPEELAIVRALEDGPQNIDQLVLLTALGVPRLRSLLLTWTVEGVVREGPPGQFKLAKY